MPAEHTTQARNAADIRRHRPRIGAALPCLIVARVVTDAVPLPPILIFEATCALDSDSAHAIKQELARLFDNRTTLIIAHRLSTLVGAHESS